LATDVLLAKKISKVPGKNRVGLHNHPRVVQRRVSRPNARLTNRLWWLTGQWLQSVDTPAGIFIGFITAAPRSSRRSATLSLLRTNRQTQVELSQ